VAAQPRRRRPGARRKKKKAPKKGRRRLSERQKQQRLIRRRVAYAIGKGKRLSRVMRVYGVSYVTAWRACREFGIELRHHAGRGSLAERRRTYILLRRRRQPDYPTRLLAESLGMSRTQVTWVIREAERRCSRSRRLRPAPPPRPPRAGPSPHAPRSGPDSGPRSA
jgi:hypothetical protein